METLSRIYAVLCPPALGHLNPFMALAHELESRGHQIIFYQLKDYEDLLKRSGFNVQVYGEKEFPLGAWCKSSENFATLSGEPAMKHFIDAVERKTQGGLRDLPEMLKEDRVDAILADQIGLESSSIAEFLDLPFATLCNALPLDSDSSTPPFFTDWDPSFTSESRLRNSTAYQALDAKIQPTLDSVNIWRKKNDLSVLSHRQDSYSKILKMIRLPLEFDFPRQANPQTHWIGPLIYNGGGVQYSFPWERLNGKPIVYVSMGSEINRRFSSFQLVINALEKEDIQLIVSLGRPDADVKVLSCAPSTIVCPFVSQNEVLNKASLFVTHGGLNSVLESICAEVPMLALPTANDQFGICSRIRHHGIGDYLLESEVSESRIQELFQKIFFDDQIAQRLQILARSSSAMQAQTKAADLIERILLPRNPVFSEGASHENR